MHLFLFYQLQKQLMQVFHMLSPYLNDTVSMWQHNKSLLASVWLFESAKIRLASDVAGKHFIKSSSLLA